MKPYPLTLAEIEQDANPGHRHATRKRATAALLLAALAALEALDRECVMVHRFGGDHDNTRAANAAENAARAVLAQVRP